MKKTIITLTIALSLWTTCLAEAAFYYVATNGNDANPGTSSQPFRTIGKGASRLAPGDTLIVGGGTYVEPALDNKIPAGSSWSAPVTIKGTPGATVLQSTTTGGVPGINIRNGRRFIRIDGLVIDMIKVANTGGIKIHDNASDIEVLNSEVKNVGRGDRANAVQVQYGSARIVFRGCKIHDVTRIPAGNPGNHGFYWKGSYGIIENCEIYNIQGWGIQFYASEGIVANDNIFRYNIIRNTGQRSINAEGALTVSTGVRNKIYQNLIINSHIGIHFSQGPNEISNNTIYNNSSYGVYIKSTATDVVVKNNIIFKNNPNISNLGNRSVLSNNFTSDPLFVDPANGNFSLKSGSPAAGLGAYELVGSTGSTVAAPIAPSSLNLTVSP